MSEPVLTMSANWHEEADFLAEQIRTYASDGQHLQILEAGCGQDWPLDLDGLSYTLTGIDLDPDALAMRVDKGDLDHAEVGDLRNVALPEGQFDVIFNSFVIEHVDGAELVLDNFVRWLKPGGLLLLRFPDKESVYGFVTSASPHWFHVFYKRWIVGNKNSGKPGHEPFRTFYDPVVSRSGFRRFCEARELVIQVERGFPTTELASGIRTSLAVAGARAVGALSMGHLSSAHMWLTYAVRKPSADVS